MSHELAKNKLIDKLPTLRERAAMFQKARLFFSERGVLEVYPPSLIHCPQNDPNIDLISTDQDGAFLHSSPEYAMKRLLSAGIGDCYFMGHVFRKNEMGNRHNPEFTMVEWYRIGFSLLQMIQETCEFLFLFFGKKEIEIITYKEAFTKYVGINISTISDDELKKLTNSNWDKESAIHYLISHKIEPKLGQNKLSVLIDFPPEEAALATIVEKDGERVAERFEVYHEGLELTNGYHELSDSKELKKRFQKNNQNRISLGKPPYEYDELFLNSLDTLPDCSGVALGFDRALMLKAKLPSIKSAIPFPS